MKAIGIYKIESKLKPNRFYIGSAINIGNRWNVHLNYLKNSKHHSKKLQRHFDKYGIGDLKFSVLLTCQSEDLIKIEQYFIDNYKPYFNICKIAGNSLGLHWKVSKEGRKNISNGHKGEKHYLYKKQMPEKTKQKISEAKKGKTTNRNYYCSEETKMKISKSLKGRHHSEESKQKMKGRIPPNKNKKYSIESKEKMKDAWRIRKLIPVSEETRRKQSEAQKMRKLNLINLN